MIRSRGFTLVEILLAITLLSMLLALAYGGLHASTRATERGQIILEESSRVRMAHQFVRKQLNQAIPMAFNQTEENLLGAEDPEFFRQFAVHSLRRAHAGLPGRRPAGPATEHRPGEEGLALILEHALVQGFEESLLAERAPIQLMITRLREFQFQAGMRKVSYCGPMFEDFILPVAISLEVEFEEVSRSGRGWLQRQKSMPAS
jgi:general secretion pathway protein J